MKHENLTLVHGLGVDHRMWALQEPALQEVSRVWAPDLPGFGDEPPLPAGRCTANVYADWLASCIAALPGGATHLAGYSMGGTLAMLVALRHPQRVRSLALCCTSPCWGRGWRRGAAAVFAGLGGRLAMEVFQLSVRWAYARHWGAREHAGAVREMVARAHRPTMRRLYLELARLNLLASLARLACPTLVVAGARDWLAPPTHARLLAAAVPGARLHVVEDADHILCLGRAAELNVLLVEFFRGGPQGRRPA